MRFTKMQGIGNDYVYVNGFEESVEDPSEAARLVSDRHFGIGSDGLILICPSETADAKMVMYNSDGTLGSMCGNGVRCVAKYVYDYGIARKQTLHIETGSGIRELFLTFDEEGLVDQVRVNMGQPELRPDRIPVVPALLSGRRRLERQAVVESFPDSEEAGLEKNSPVISRTLEVRGSFYQATCVSMGNPHCVIPVEDPSALNLEKIGPYFEHLEAFPDRVNTEFIKVRNSREVEMRVWERGAGETLACGTGACAVAVACILNGWTERKVTVALRGGNLEIEWNEEDGNVYMTGPARKVFDGIVSLKELACGKGA